MREKNIDLQFHLFMHSLVISYMDLDQWSNPHYFLVCALIRDQTNNLGVWGPHSNPLICRARTPTSLFAMWSLSCSYRTILSIKYSVIHNFHGYTWCSVLPLNQWRYTESLRKTTQKRNERQSYLPRRWIRKMIGKK